MRDRTRTNDVVSAAPPYRRPTSYKPCDDCGEGALAWDARRGESTCTACGAAYRGPREGGGGGAVPC